MLFHRALTYLIAALSAGNAASQWEIQDAHTTASLRGIHYVGNGVAWASGTDGTVLRTEDMGFVWQLCAIPPGGEKLDFRGIQAFDNNTAIVMSSGKGDLSRLYKTTDGCQTWKLVFTNPDKDGFWDTILLNRLESDGLLFGDPVNGRFVLWRTADKGEHWARDPSLDVHSLPGEGAFAASNSILVEDDHSFIHFGTGGGKQVRFVSSNGGEAGWGAVTVDLAAGSSATGIFSIAFRTFLSKYVIGSAHFVAIGGDYSKPSKAQGTAAYSVDDGHTWTSSKTSPHGYRSAVAYDRNTGTWITVGPNGTDISTDDGRNWHPLKPGPGDAPDADQHWNALSLPFVVGPKGRIGLLHSDLLAQSKVH